MQWTTRDVGRPVARYGRSRAALDFAAPAASATYTAAEMCGEPATTFGFLPPGQLHTAVLSGLEPGAAYAYQVGDAGPGGQWSEVFEFHAPPAPGPGQAVHILVLADQGVGEAAAGGRCAAGCAGAAAWRSERGEGDGHRVLLAAHLDAPPTLHPLHAWLPHGARRAGRLIPSHGVSAGAGRGAPPDR